MPLSTSGDHSGDLVALFALARVFGSFSSMFVPLFFYILYASTHAIRAGCVPPGARGRRETAGSRKRTEGDTGVGTGVGRGEFETLQPEREWYSPSREWSVCSDKTIYKDTPHPHFASLFISLYFTLSYPPP